MSLPAGFGEGAMPVGLQLIGNYFQEGTLLHAAHAFQQATDWHARTPARATDHRPMSIPCPDPRLRGRHRHRDARATVHAIEDFQRVVDPLRCRAQHPGVAGRPGPAGHLAGHESRRGRAGDPLRAGGRRQGGAGVDLRAQELLLSRPAQGLPDQPVRNPGGAGRRGRILSSRRRAARGRRSGTPSTSPAPTSRRTPASRCTRTTRARPAST